MAILRYSVNCLILLLPCYIHFIEVNSLVAQYENPLKQCGAVKCRAGRECRILSSGIAVCACQRKCPDRKHPICGSDGMAYENHCELHREACIKGAHIYPLFEDKSCHRDPLAKLKRELAKAKEEIREVERLKIRVPRACHQNDRDRTREFLMSWIRITSRKQPWFDKNLSYKSMIVHHFEAVDAFNNKNGYVGSDEWLHYFLEYRRNKSISTIPPRLSSPASHHSLKAHHHSQHKLYSHTRNHESYVSNRTLKSQLKRDKQNERMRKLCIEALVEEGDRDQDWRLTLNEFSNLMDPDYQPSSKYCIRDRRHYEDATRIKVDCNGCTCACGKWICTSKLCGSYNDLSSSHEQKADDNVEKQYDDMDNQID